MSLIASLGAIEIGLIFGLVALGVFLSFRIINFPDLTVDGSFPLGGAVAAALIVAGWNPFAATAAAIVAGALAGYLTAWLNVHLRIMQLLASILVMIALYSVNLRIMGKPNVALINDATVFSLVEFGGVPDYWLKPLFLLAIVIAAKVLIDLFFASEAGLAMRATGGNPRMARAQGISTDRLTVWGLALSNGLVALAGALFVQSQGGADISMGIGTIVIGLAAVIIGETILPARSLVDHDAGLHPRRGALPLLHRAGAQQRLHRPAGPGPEPGHRRAGRPRAACSHLQAQAGRPVARRARSTRQPPSRRPSNVARQRSRDHLQPRHADREPGAARAGPDHPHRAVRHRHRLQRRRQVDLPERRQRRPDGRPRQRSRSTTATSPAARRGSARTWSHASSRTRWPAPARR